MASVVRVTLIRLKYYPVTPENGRCSPLSQGEAAARIKAFLERRSRKRSLQYCVTISPSFVSVVLAGLNKAKQICIKCLGGLCFLLPASEEQETLVVFVPLRDHVLPEFMSYFILVVLILLALPHSNMLRMSMASRPMAVSRIATSVGPCLPVFSDI